MKVKGLFYKRFGDAYLEGVVPLRREFMSFEIVLARPKLRGIYQNREFAVYDDATGTVRCAHD